MIIFLIGKASFVNWDQIKKTKKQQANEQPVNTEMCKS